MQQGMITPEQLQEALSLQHSGESNEVLGRILLKLGYIGEDELYSILAVQSGYPYINISNCIIELKALSLLPESFARKYQLLPIDKIGDVFTVAMVNPLDKSAVDEIQNITRASVEIFLTTPLELEEMFSRCYGSK